MKIKFLSWASGLAMFFVALSIACSRGPQVGFDRDSSVNLKNFSTFRVEAEKEMAKDPLMGSELNRRRMAAAVTEAMQAKGYGLDENAPQIVVRFTMDVRERQELRGSSPYYPYRRWWNSPMNDVSTYIYQEGRVILNVYQAETDRMVWQGWVSGEVRQAGKKESPEENAKNLAVEILRSFPSTGEQI